MMEPADGHRVFVADLAAKCARLGEAKVMGLRGRSAADDAWLCGDEIAVFLITQADYLRRDTTAAGTRRFPAQRAELPMGFPLAAGKGSWP